MLVSDKILLKINTSDKKAIYDKEAIVSNEKL